MSITNADLIVGTELQLEQNTFVHGSQAPDCARLSSSGAASTIRNL